LLGNQSIKLLICNLV